MVCHNNISLKLHERQLESALSCAVIHIATIGLDIRRQSSLVSLFDDRDSLSQRREQLDADTAVYIAGLVNLAQDHNVDALARLNWTELQIVQQAIRSLPWEATR